MDLAGLVLSSVQAILKIASAITEAVQMVRRNKEECEDIDRSVASVSAVLKRLCESTPAMAVDPAMGGALEDLAVSLRRALDLVNECQEKRRVPMSFLRARDMATDLRRVKINITDKLTLVNLAANVQINITLNNMHPPPPPAGGATTWNPAPVWTPSYVAPPQPTMPRPRPAPPTQVALPSMAEFCCPSNWHLR